MYSLILLGVAVLTIVLCAGFAALFGLSKTKVHLIITAASAAVVLAFCWLIKLVLPTADTIMTLVRDNMDWIGAKFGADAVSIAEQALEYAAISPTLVELVLQLAVALLLPLLCVALFVLSFGAAWFISLIISGIAKIVRRKRAAEEDDEDDERPRQTALSRLAATGLGAVQGVIIVAILFIPISCYLSIAQPTLGELTAQGVLPADDPTIVQVQDIMDELDAAPVLNVYRMLGGRALSDSVMSMKVAGMNVKVSEELSSVITLAQQVIELSKTEFESYGEEQAEIIRSIGDSFAESRVLSPIVGDIVYAATDAWLSGEEFLGMERPSLGENGEILEPMVTALLEILHDDAKQTLLLQADVKTTAELVSILARNGVFAHLSNMNALMDSLSGDAVSSMVTALGENQSMKRMIPEIMNLGVRVIGQVLQIPANTEAVYDNYMTTVADALNDVRSLPEEQRIQTLSAELSTAFDLAGMDVDEQVMEFYAAAMLHDLVDGNPNEVTEQDVQAFFTLYAQGAVQTTATLSTKPRFDLLTNTETTDPLAGSVYERMTEEQRQSSAAVAVATLCVHLSVLDENDEEITQKATELITATFTELLGSDSTILAVVVSVQITTPVPATTTECTSSLQSTEEMKKTSKVVTMEMLLIDTKAAAEGITPETVGADAAAISAIFETASSLSSALDGGEIDIAEVATSVGTILDALAETDTFGKDKTAGLFTSVLQSETVRDAANLDMKTATQLAEKATEGDVNYSETMSTVAGAVNIMDSLAADGTISEEELVDLIRNLNSQTAGMIEVYVTPARLVENNIPEKFSEISSDLIKSLFGYIADSDKANSETEAKALNQILNIALAAKESDDKKLFSSAPGAEDGRLPTATESVNTLLDSMSVRHALVDVLTDGNKVTVFDPYELSGKIKEESNDYKAAVDAIYEYRAQHPEVDDLVFEALAALLGVQVDLSK